MVSKWTEHLLGDVIELKRGFDLPQSQRRQGNVPIVSSSGVSGTHSEPRVAGPGVVTGRYGTLGQVFFVLNDFWPLNTTLFVSDFKGNDPKFVSYFLRTLDFLSYSNFPSGHPRRPLVGGKKTHRVRSELAPISRTVD